MRHRSRAVAVLAAAVVLLAGCAEDRPDRPSGGASGPTPGSTARAVPGGSGAPAPSGTAGGNAAQVCAAASKAGATAVQTYVTELGKMMTAAGANDTKGADAARRAAAVALADWRTELLKQSGQATDPRLKALLAEIAAEVATVKPDLDSIDSGHLDQLQQRLDQLCGS